MEKPAIRTATDVSIVVLASAAVLGIVTQTVVVNRLQSEIDRQAFVIRSQDIVIRALEDTYVHGGDADGD